MRKKTLIVFLILLGVGLSILVGFNFLSSSSLPPFPLLAREKVKFSLNKELSKAEINLNQGLVWNKELMSFQGLTNEGIKVIFSETIKAQAQISSLQLILKKSKMITDGESQVKVIDLRTVDPYVSIKDN